MYTENDNIDRAAIEKLKQLPPEELDRMIEERERLIIEKLNKI